MQAAKATQDTSKRNRIIQDVRDKVGEGQNKESSDQSERKTSFWSGLWNRNKDHGSKENMLEDAGAEKKDLDDGKLIIITSSIQAEL